MIDFGKGISEMRGWLLTSRSLSIVISSLACSYSMIIDCVLKSRRLQKVLRLHKGARKCCIDDTGGLIQYRG